MLLFFFVVAKYWTQNLKQLSAYSIIFVYLVRVMDVALTQFSFCVWKLENNYFNYRWTKDGSQVIKLSLRRL